MAAKKKKAKHAHAEAHAQGHAHAHAEAHAHAHAHDDGHAHGHAHGQAHEHEHEHEHGHGHEHEHEHAHPHEHPHAHARAVTREGLSRDAGRGDILFLDAPSGLAGDMIIAALVDLGVPGEIIADAVAQLPLTGYHLHFGTRERSGIVATSFDVHVDAKQPERTYGEIREMLEDAKLAPGVQKRALSTFRRLAESEALVHAMPLEDVHFHEVGAIDAIVDVVGSAAALDYIGAALVVSPLPMGHGFVKARHGILPLPAPAVVHCLRGIPTYDGGIAFELVTPTGAAIVGAHASSSTRWPSFTPKRSGWGAGTANLADRPNLLRAVLGTPNAVTTPTRGSHVVLEANVDDATGELLASCIESLLAAGALDAWATPATMKKGRPAFVLSAIAPASLADVVTKTMLRESTTIGVRRHDVDRTERPRRLVEVKTSFGLIPVKVAEGDFGPPQRKPEFDACLAAARAHGVPVRQVIEAALIASVAV